MPTRGGVSAQMTKQEVCAFLQKSKRTIEGYVKTGRLNQQYIDAPNGVRAIFDRGEVEAFKKSASAVPVARPAPVALDRADPFAGLPAHLAKLSALFPPPDKLGAYVGIDEAAKISNLPRAWLIRQARAGVPWAVNVSGSTKREVWRFRLEVGGIIRGS